jgi:hypothetical protein
VAQSLELDQWKLSRSITWLFSAKAGVHSVAQSLRVQLKVTSVKVSELAPPSSGVFRLRWFQNGLLVEITNQHHVAAVFTIRSVPGPSFPNHHSPENQTLSLIYCGSNNFPLPHLSSQAHASLRVLPLLRTVEDGS